MAEKIEKIRSVGELVQDSVNIFKTNWKKFIVFELVAFAAILIPMIMIILSLGLTARSFPEINSYLLSNPTSPVSVNPGIFKNFFTSALTHPLFIIGGILLIILSVVYNLGFYRTVYTSVEGKETTLVENVKYAFNNLLPYLGISILMALIVFLGIIFFVVPGLVFIVWFSFFPLIYILGENHKATALKESKELVKGYFWPVVGRLLVATLLVQLISYLLNYTWNNSLIEGIFGLLSVVFSIIIPGIMAAYLYFIYSDLVAIKK